MDCVRQSGSRGAKPVRVAIMDETECQKKLLTASDEFLGNFGEAVWSNIFKASGVNYVPLSKIEVGGAPMMLAKTGGTVLPDFDCAGDDWTAYVDSKCKTRNVLFRKTDQIRHGIDHKNWRQYQKVAAQFRKKCALAILELFTHEGRWSGTLLIETLDNLGQPFGGISNQDHMVYWKRDAFTDLDSLTAMELVASSRGQAVPSFQHEFRQVFAPAVQRELFG